MKTCGCPPPTCAPQFELRQPPALSPGAHLRQSLEPDDPRIRALLAALAQWRAGFTWAQRLGLRAKPPLPRRRKAERGDALALSRSL